MTRWLRSIVPSTAVTRPDQAVCGIANLTADQIVPVIRPLRQRRQRLAAGIQTSSARKPLGVVHRLDALERENRAALVEPDLLDPPRRPAAPRADQQHLPRLETAPRESPSPGSRSPARGLPCGTRHPADENEIVQFTSSAAAPPARPGRTCDVQRLGARWSLFVPELERDLRALEVRRRAPACAAPRRSGPGGR